MVPNQVEAYRKVGIWGNHSERANHGASDEPKEFFHTSFHCHGSAWKLGWSDTTGVVAIPTTALAAARWHATESGECLV